MRLYILSVFIYVIYFISCLLCFISYLFIFLYIIIIIYYLILNTVGLWTASHRCPSCSTLKNSGDYTSPVQYIQQITMFSLPFIVTATQYLMPNQCCNEALSLFLHFLTASLSLCILLPLFLPLSLSLSFPLSGGLPAMSPWLLLRCCGSLSSFRRMLGRFLLSDGCTSP